MLAYKYVFLLLRVSVLFQGWIELSTCRTCLYLHSSSVIIVSAYKNGFLFLEFVLFQGWMKSLHLEPVFNIAIKKTHKETHQYELHLI